MQISFPHDRPAVYTLNGTVAFPAVVDGRDITCEVSDEALKECFHGEAPADASKSEYDKAMVEAFESARAEIEEAAAKCLRRNPKEICLLRRDDF